MQSWFVAVAGKQLGPWPTEEVVRRIQTGEIPRDAHVFAQGMAGWEPVASRAEFSEAFMRPAAPAPAPAALQAQWAAQSSGQVAHEIDYEILGDDMQFVESTLDPQEAVHRRGRRDDLHGAGIADGDDLRRRLAASSRAASWASSSARASGCSPASRSS